MTRIKKEVRVDPPSEPYMIHPHPNTGKIPPRIDLTLCVLKNVSTL